MTETRQPLRGKTRHTWEDPPSTSGKGRWARSRHYEIAAQLREHPGEWALIATSSPSMAGAIPTGILQAYPAGSFDAVARNSRKNNNGGPPKVVSEICARLIGDDHE
jgi:hypothetical protein